jgi:hypothetical protein
LLTRSGSRCQYGGVIAVLADIAMDQQRRMAGGSKAGLEFA